MPTPPLNAGTSRPSNVDEQSRPLVGIAFPFRKEDGEFPKRVRDAECVKDDVITLFKQSVRSRIMRPTVGTNAQSCVFESQGQLLNARLQRSIRQTIANHEPRIRLERISVTAEDREVTPTIVYSVKGVRETVELEPFDKG